VAESAFLLCRYITGKFFPSVCGGYLFGFSPYMLGHMLLGQPNLTLIFGVPTKRHDLLLRSVKGTRLTDHLHLVDTTGIDLTGASLTTSNWYDRNVADLLRTSRIAVYPGDRTLNPAAMWERVAAGLPIVVNGNIAGGKHLVIPGVTGELASEEGFRATIQEVLANRASSSPASHDASAAGF